MARAEISLHDSSRELEIVTEISRICSLTEDIQDQVLDEYYKQKSEIIRETGYTGKDDSENVTLFALVSLIMVPRVKTMISKFSFSITGSTICDHPRDPQNYKFHFLRT